MLIRTILMLFCATWLISCDNSSRCFDSTDTQMVALFTSGKSAKIGSFLVKGYGRNGVGDTLAYSKDSSLTKRVSLPLSLSADSTGFLIEANGYTSLLWLKHSMNLQLVSKSCGFSPYYQLKASRYSARIDSLAFYDLSVDPKSIERFATNGQNVAIYLHLSAN
ncbi:MAG: DUF6452 family protein [Marinilabiliales bacterium]|nr:DUF6452 family protein [Marinilabiliales bacterium]